MTFTFTVWYFVMLILVAGIAACLVLFFQMDKKDRVLIDEFIKASQPKEEPAQQVASEENKEEK